jgi:Kef-type K+ transport system membrane component KefB
MTESASSSTLAQGSRERRHAPKGAGTRLIQALALAVVFALLWLTDLGQAGSNSQLTSIAALGFLLLAGTLLSELLEPLGLPHLSGYLAAGLLAGPHVGHLLDHTTIDALAPVNTLTISLIALAGGVELRISTLQPLLKSVGVGLLLQCGVGLVLMVAVFVALAPWISFTQGMSFAAVFGVALLWGVLAVSRSPSACMAILSQTRARGPVTDYSLAFVMTSDVVVVVMMAAALLIARPLIEGGTSISLSDLNVLGREIVGSVTVGTTLGLLLAVFLRFIGRNLLLVLLGLGFVVTDFMRYVHIDPLLAFLTTGFVVQNLTHQGEKLLEAVRGISSIVFVVFFGIAGAHLDLPLLQRMWPIALALTLFRGLFTFGIAKFSSRVANDPEPIRRWGWSSLISQAGLTLGLSLIVVRAFPQFGGDFRSLVIATVAMNEVVGPICFKLALDRSGETDLLGQEREAAEPEPEPGSAHER